MKRLSSLFKLAAFCLILAAAVSAQEGGEQKAPGQKASQTRGGGKTDGGRYIPVHTYDPARNAEQDIDAAVREAGRAGKRVLLEVGGEWCIWCHTMDGFFEKNPELLSYREKNFVMLKVNFSEENKNERALSRYPQISGYPHIFVLDRDGKFLHSQDTGQLEEGKSYDLAKFMAFLKQWSPPASESAR
jgi:thiol:disulfide interchange protein